MADIKNKLVPGETFEHLVVTINDLIERVEALENIKGLLDDSE